MVRDFVASSRIGATAAAVVVAIVVALLAACGVKGPLRLPPTPPAAPPEATSTDAPAGASSDVAPGPREATPRKP